MKRCVEWGRVSALATLVYAMMAGMEVVWRRIRLTALARRRAVAKSTLSETLMVVESKVFHRFRATWVGRGAPPSFQPHATVKNGHK